VKLYRLAITVPLQEPKTAFIMLDPYQIGASVAVALAFVKSLSAIAVQAYVRTDIFSLDTRHKRTDKGNRIRMDRLARVVAGIMPCAVIVNKRMF
jgi:hypothetical protein